MALAPSDPAIMAYASATARSRSRTGTAPDSSGVGGGYVAPPAYSSPVGATVERVPTTPAVGDGQPSGVLTPFTPGQAAAPGQPASSGGEWTMPGINDPSWQVISRGYQQQADTFKQNAEMRRQMIQQMLTQGKSSLEQEGVYGRRDISSDAESRGILRSGELQRNLAEQMAKEQERLGSLELNAANQSTELETGLAGDLSGLRQRFTEAQQRAAQDQYAREAEAEARRRALEAVNATPAPTTAPSFSLPSFAAPAPAAPAAPAPAPAAASAPQYGYDANGNWISPFESYPTTYVQRDAQGRIIGRRF